MIGFTRQAPTGTIVAMAEGIEGLAGETPGTAAEAGTAKSCIVGSAEYQRISK